MIATKCMHLKNTLLDVYLSPDLAGDALVKPSKYVYYRLWSDSSTQQTMMKIVLRCFATLLQIACSPLTLTGCVIKALNISSFLRTSNDFQKKTLDLFDATARLWKETNFTSFETIWYSPSPTKRSDESLMFSQEIALSELKQNQPYDTARELLVNLMKQQERQFRLVGGIGTTQSQIPGYEPTYVINVYFQKA